MDDVMVMDPVSDEAARMNQTKQEEMAKAIETGKDWGGRIKDVGVLVYRASEGTFYVLKDAAVEGGERVVEAYKGVKAWWSSMEGQDFRTKVKALWQVIWAWISGLFNKLADKALAAREKAAKAK